MEQPGGRGLSPLSLAQGRASQFVSEDDSSEQLGSCFYKPQLRVLVDLGAICYRKYLKIHCWYFQDLIIVSWLCESPWN